MRKKFFSIFLSCFLVISSAVNSFALAPAVVAVVPELANVVATLAVASGVALTTKDDIYDVVRLVYENTPNWDSFVDTFKRDVSISADNVIRIGNDFLDMCKFAFDNTFLSVPSSYNSISAVGSLVQGSTIDLKNYSAPFEIGFSNFKVTCEVDSGSSGTVAIYVPYEDGSGFFRCAGYYTNLTLLDKYTINSIKIQGYKTILDITYYMLPSQWNPSGSYYRKTYTSEKPLAGVAYDLPYVPGSYDWDKVAGKVVPGEDGLDVYVPNNSGDLIGVPGEDVFVGENNPPYDLPISGTVTVPKVENPSIPIEGDYVIPPSADYPDPPDPDPPDPDPNPNVPSIKLDWTPIIDSMKKFTTKFPFSAVWDIKRFLDIFNVEPLPPKFQFDLVGYPLVIDLSSKILSDVLKIVKFFEYISFVFALILLTYKLSNRGGD